jgi:hypothetical protein
MMRYNKIGGSCTLNAFGGSSTTANSRETFNILNVE